jgi:O-antigen ligase
LRILLAVILFVILTAALVSFSRAAVISVAFLLIAMLLRDGRNKRGLFVGVVIVAGVAFLMPADVWMRMETLGAMTSRVNTDWSLRLRLMLLESGWKMFLADPITGVGIGNYIVKAADVFAPRVTHNSFLDVAVGTGIVGLMAYLTMIWVGIRGFVRAMRARWAPEYEWMPHLVFYTMMSLATVLISSMFLSLSFEYIIWLPVAAGLVADGVTKRYALPPETTGNDSARQ